MTARQVRIREMEEARLASQAWGRRPGNLPHPFLPVKGGKTSTALLGLAKTIKELK